jgi:hypothetical protein
VLRVQPQVLKVLWVHRELKVSKVHKGQILVHRVRLDSKVLKGPQGLRVQLQGLKVLLVLRVLKVFKEHKVPTKGLKEQQDSKVLKEPQELLVQHKVPKVP